MTVIEFLTFIFSIPPERMTGLTALGVIVLAMLWVVREIMRERNK